MIVRSGCAKLKSGSTFHPSIAVSCIQKRGHARIRCQSFAAIIRPKAEHAVNAHQVGRGFRLISFGAGGFGISRDGPGCVSEAAYLSSVAVSADEASGRSGKPGSVGAQSRGVSSRIVWTTARLLAEFNERPRL